jgi:hypothetical protein
MLIKGMFMQNDFEKQVQQKMGELKLVPSEPVWEKVEMQIRKKKDRRAVIFWIPLIALIGAGLWFGMEKYSGQTAYTKLTPAAPQHTSIETPVSQDNSPQENPQNTTATKTVQDKTIPHLKKAVNTLTAIENKSSSKKISTGTAVPDKDKNKKTSSPVVEEGMVTTNTTIIHSGQPAEKVNSSNKPPENPEAVVGKEEKTAEKATEPVKHDSASVAPSLKKHASTKWKYNVGLVMGSSGLGRIEFYNGMKSASVYSSPPLGTSSGSNYQAGSYGPPAVEKSLAFAVAATARKQLSKKTYFSTGLQYNYYSNIIQVGQQVNQNRTISSYSVSQYYTAQASLLQPYKNQYHFVSVPADIDWQLLRKHPLNLSVGVSFQYLVASNALRYDYTSQAYFHDINAFNRAQLFSALALTYSVPLMQRPLSFGPQLQYGFTRIEKGNADNHLFSYGLKAQWQLKK